MSKDSLPKIVKNVSEMQSKATKVGKDAIKTASSLKEKLQTGLGSSKDVLQKASERASGMINKKGISQGIETASKGIDIMARGARIASKGAETLATTMEKASEQIRKAKNKIKE
jgi:uncharacterized phage infection (PIP) family protein YhgE